MERELKVKKRQIEAEKEKEREMREKLREKEEMNDEVSLKALVSCQKYSLFSVFKSRRRTEAAGEN